MEYVNRIATADQRERRENLLGILRAENIPFSHQGAKINGHWVENIVVSINPGRSAW